MRNIEIHGPEINLRHEIKTRQASSPHCTVVWYGENSSELAWDEDPGWYVIGEGVRRRAETMGQAKALAKQINAFA